MHSEIIVFLFPVKALSSTEVFKMNSKDNHKFQVNSSTASTSDISKQLDFLQRLINETFLVLKDKIDTLMVKQPPELNCNSPRDTTNKETALHKRFKKVEAENEELKQVNDDLRKKIENLQRKIDNHVRPTVSNQQVTKPKCKTLNKSSSTTDLSLSQPSCLIAPFIPFSTHFDIDPKNVAPQELRMSLLRLFSGNNFVMNFLNHHNYVRVSSFAEYAPSIEKMFTEMGFHFITCHSLDEPKHDSFILRGMPLDTDDTVIRNVLANADIKYVSLRKHSTCYLRQNDIPSSLWRIRVMKGTSIEIFDHILDIDGHPVTFEPLKNRPSKYD